MLDYKLKEKIEKYFAYGKNQTRINLLNRRTFWLRRKQLANYEKLNNNNARLDLLMKHVFMDNAARLLWVPPTKPYYEPQGVYKNIHDFSKTLVFSSWEMVPRMITCLVSYEAERQNMQSLKTQLKKEDDLREIQYFLDDGEEDNLTKGTRYPRPRMKFSYDSKEGRPRGMALFCLVYPSDFLTRAYDPVACLNDNMSLVAIRAQVKAKIESVLEKYPESAQVGPTDKRWYYLAPLLLDDELYTGSWFHNEEEADEVDGANRYKDHLTELQNIYKRVINKARKRTCKTYCASTWIMP